MGTGDSKALFVQLVKTWFLVGGGVWDCGGTPPDRGCTSTRGKAPHPPIHRREDALVNGPFPAAAQRSQELAPLPDGAREK